MNGEQTPQKIDDGGPAFPEPIAFFEGCLETSRSWAGEGEGGGGMSLRTYAAIKLKVPNSGIDWLDEMIQQANRLEFAGMAMQGILPSIPNYRNEHDMIGKVTKISFSYADAMISASQKEQPA